MEKLFLTKENSGSLFIYKSENGNPPVKNESNTGWEESPEDGHWDYEWIEVTPGDNDIPGEIVIPDISKDEIFEVTAKFVIEKV